jgi:hypothetical protein
MDPTGDLDIFFEDLGVPAIIGGKSITVLFNSPSKALSSFDISVISTAPTCTVKSADVAANAIDSGSIVAIGGVTYQVAGAPEHDGAGLAILTLTEA